MRLLYLTEGLTEYSNFAKSILCIASPPQWHHLLVFFEGLPKLTHSNKYMYMTVYTTIVAICTL